MIRSRLERWIGLKTAMTPAHCGSVCSEAVSASDAAKWEPETLCTSTDTEQEKLVLYPWICDTSSKLRRRCAIFVCTLIVARCCRVLKSFNNFRRLTSLSVVSLLHSLIDFGNFALVGQPACLQRQLQSVLNAAARLVFRLRRYDHISLAVFTGSVNHNGSTIKLRS